MGGDEDAQAEVIRSELAGRGFCCASHASTSTPSRGAFGVGELGMVLVITSDRMAQLREALSAAISH